MNNLDKYDIEVFKEIIKNKYFMKIMANENIKRKYEIQRNPNTANRPFFSEFIGYEINSHYKDFNKIILNWAKEILNRSDYLNIINLFFNKYDEYVNTCRLNSIKIKSREEIKKEIFSDYQVEDKTNKKVEILMGYLDEIKDHEPFIREEFDRYEKHDILPNETIINDEMIDNNIYISNDDSSGGNSNGKTLIKKY